MKSIPLVILTVTVMILAACDEGRLPSSTEVGSSGPTQSTTQTPEAEALQAKVDQIDAQVAAIRSLSFNRPVHASWVPRSHIQALQDSISRVMGYSTDTAGSGAQDEIFQALGYLDSTSLDSSSSSFMDQNILAFYVRGTDHLWVVSDQAGTKGLDQTIAHELVHALQDQNFSDGWANVNELDDAEAYKFLVEGEAEYVANLWARGDATVAGWDSYAAMFTASVFAQRIAQSSYADDKPILVWPTISPYLCGTTYVHQVRKSSGWAGVNDLHAHPTRTTTQALSAGSGGLHQTFLDWSGDYSFTSMSDRRAYGSGRLGEIYLDALLATWSSPVLTGWNGDRFWIWGRTATRGTAVAGRTAWASATSASNFLAGWAAGMKTKVGSQTVFGVDSMEFQSLDGVRSARGVRRGSEVLMVWGDLRTGKLEPLWSELSRLPAPGTFARSLGGAESPAPGPKWKAPHADSPFWL